MTRWGLTVSQYMGDAHLALGDPDAARDCYRRVLASENDSGTVARCHAAYGTARLALMQDPPDLRLARQRLDETQRMLAETEMPTLEREVSVMLADLDRSRDGFTTEHMPVGGRSAESR